MLYCYYSIFFDSNSLMLVPCQRLTRAQTHFPSSQCRIACGIVKHLRKIALIPKLRQNKLPLRAYSPAGKLDLHTLPQFAYRPSACQYRISAASCRLRNNIVNRASVGKRVQEFMNSRNLASPETGGPPCPSGVMTRIPGHHSSIVPLL